MTALPLDSRHPAQHPNQAAWVWLHDGNARTCCGLVSDMNLGATAWEHQPSAHAYIHTCRGETSPNSMPEPREMLPDSFFSGALLASTRIVSLLPPPEAQQQAPDDLRPGAVAVVVAIVAVSIVSSPKPMRAGFLSQLAFSHFLAPKQPGSLSGRSSSRLCLRGAKGG